MLDLTRIGHSYILIYAEAYEKVGQELVSVVHLYRYLASYVGKGNISVLIHRYISSRFEKAYRA